MRFTRRHFPALLTLILGVGLSATISATLEKWEQDRAQAIFERRSNTITKALQVKLDDYSSISYAFEAFYSANQEFNKTQFQKLSQSFFERYKGIYAQNWVTPVSRNERSQFEQARQAEGVAGFQVHQLNTQGQAQPVSDRPLYYPITYAEPLPQIEKVLGFDFGSNPERFAALAQARDTGRPAVTDRITLLAKDSAGFVLAHPIYAAESRPSTLAARNQSFRGVFVGVYSIPEILETAIAGLRVTDLNFHLIDLQAKQPQHRFLAFYSAEQQTIQTSLDADFPRSPDKISGCDRLLCNRVVTIGDRQWLLQLQPTPAYRASQHYWFAESILVIGVLVTGGLAFYLYQSTETTNKISALVAARTAELSEEVAERRRAEAVLRDSEQALRARSQQLQQALDDLHRTQAQLVQTEKMSALGQLVAGVAHEINNPVNFIYGNLQHTATYTQDLLTLVNLYQQDHPSPSPQIQTLMEEIDFNFLQIDMPKMLLSMQVGTQRIREIVKSLRNFSRLDESEIKAVDIHEGIESTLMILHNRLRAKTDRDEIEVVRDYEKLPLVECHAGQLNQVFMNLLSNALDALEDHMYATGDRGVITLETRFLDQNSVRISVCDNASGINPEIQKRLFEPFFTTKPLGKGTGLGLSISYQVVQEVHRGTLECFSKVGKGTEFRITLPVKQASAVSRA